MTAPWLDQDDCHVVSMGTGTKCLSFVKRTSQVKLVLCMLLDLQPMCVLCTMAQVVTSCFGTCRVILSMTRMLKSLRDGLCYSGSTRS